MIGDFLYGLIPSELASAPVIQRQVVRVSGTPAAALSVTVNPALTVPNDKIAIVTNISLHGLAGAGQTVSSVLAFVNDESGGILADILEFVPPTLVQFNGIGFSTYLVLMPRERLSGTAFFSAGAVANNLRVAAHVLLLPAGNLQRR